MTSAADCTIRLSRRTPLVWSPSMPSSRPSSTRCFSIVTTSSILEAYSREGDPSLFVKNLENVQGDERDVILFSISYSKDGTRPTASFPCNGGRSTPKEGNGVSMSP